MPRFLTIDVEQGQLHVASAQVRSNTIKIDRALIVPDVGTLTLASAPGIGRRLREALKDAGIAAAPVLVSVGRERLVLKEIKLPPGISAVEEANVIRFQAQKELTEAGDSVVLDYFAAATPDADGQRRALAFAMRKDLTNAYKLLCNDAGLKCVGVTPRPFGVMASFQRAVKDGAVMPPASAEWPVAVLTLGDKWAELLIGRGENVIFSRSLSTTSVSSEPALIAEIRRNLAVFNGQSPQNPVRALYVVEAETAGRWQGRIQEGIALPTFAYDPLAGIDGDTPPEARADFAALSGLFAFALRPAALPVNFLAPHEPRAERDPKKRQLVTVSAAIGFLILAGIVFGRWKVGQKEAEIDRLQAMTTDLEDEMKKLDPAWKQYKAVADWQRSGVNWLDELYDLTARFPDPKDTRVELFVGQAIEQQVNAKEKDKDKTPQPKHSAKLDLTVSTLHPAGVVGLNDSMRNDRHYSLGGLESKGANTNAIPTIGNAQPRQQYILRAQVDHRDPKDYTLVLHAEVGARPQPSMDFAHAGGAEDPAIPRGPRVGRFNGQPGFPMMGQPGNGQPGMGFPPGMPQRPPLRPPEGLQPFPFGKFPPDRANLPLPGIGPDNTPRFPGLPIPGELP